MQRYRPLCLYWGGSVHPNGLLTVTKPLLLKVMLSLIWLELSIQIFFLRNNILKSSTSLSPTRSPTSSSALCSIVQCSIVHCWTKRSLETLSVAPSAWKSYWPSLSSLFASDAMYLSKLKKNIYVRIPQTFPQRNVISNLWRNLAPAALCLPLTFIHSLDWITFNLSQYIASADRGRPDLFTHLTFSPTGPELSWPTYIIWSLQTLITPMEERRESRWCWFWQSLSFVWSQRSF